MTAAMLGGLVLVLLGLAGVADACVINREEPNLTTALLSGLAVAGGFIWMGVIGARHGYHRRPPGSPPGDMDPSKATDPIK